MHSKSSIISCSSTSILFVLFLRSFFVCSFLVCLWCSKQTKRSVELRVLALTQRVFAASPRSDRVVIGTDSCWEQLSFQLRAETRAGCVREVVDPEVRIKRLQYGGIGKSSKSKSGSDNCVSSGTDMCESPRRSGGGGGVLDRSRSIARCANEEPMLWVPEQLQTGWETNLFLYISMVTSKL